MFNYNVFTERFATRLLVFT